VVLGYNQDMPEDSSDYGADDPGHLPVLAAEVIELVDPGPGRVVLDCTVGRGGHGALLIPRLGPGGRYVGLDMDPGNVAYSRDRLALIAREAGVGLEVVHANFRDAKGVLGTLEIDAVDGVLADLGFASNQVDDPARGLTFKDDGPLDMRLDPGATVTAERLVNTLGEAELADLIYEFGEERLSRRIARKIVEQRQREPITTTSGLAELVRRAYPRPRNKGPRNKGPRSKAPRHAGSGGLKRPGGPGGSGGRGKRIDPATRTFMALRIAVNDELGALDGLLTGLPGLLKPGGRAAIISFHSLEDRRVKRAFAGLGRDAGFTVLTRKPVTAGDDEAQENPRSRSAKLRGIQRPDQPTDTRDSRRFDG
jgi:16S rRNA (cytosine1402-N4)-methyltransferase